MTDINMTTEDVMCAINNLKGMYQSSLDKDETYLFAIQALEEIQQYRAIGTMEEFKALKEKIAKIEFILNEKNYIEAEVCNYGNYYTCENALMIKDIEEIING